jgi:hypothetical protein
MISGGVFVVDVGGSNRCNFSLGAFANKREKQNKHKTG